MRIATAFAAGLVALFATGTNAAQAQVGSGIAHETLKQQALDFARQGGPAQVEKAHYRRRFRGFRKFRGFRRFGRFSRRRHHRRHRFYGFGGYRGYGYRRHYGYGHRRHYGHRRGHNSLGGFGGRRGYW